MRLIEDCQRGHPGYGDEGEGGGGGGFVRKIFVTSHLCTGHPFASFFFLFPFVTD